jgi:NADH-quinone oxidoreductase subunit C
MSLSTEVLSDRVQDGSRRIEVTIHQWHAIHHELSTAGFVRFEWLTAVHNLGDDFEIVSMVANSEITERVIVTAECTSTDPVTVTDIYLAAQFHEREVRQMFGIQFVGLADGLAFDAPFEGNPLRRDFALHERAAKPWPGAVEPDANARRRPSLPPGVFAEWTS